MSNVDIKIGDWIDVFKKTELYNEITKKLYWADEDLPFERGEIIDIKTYKGKKIVKLYTIIYNWHDGPPKRRKPEHDFIIGYHSTDNIKIVKNYKNRTVEDLTDEFHKMYSDWLDKYILEPSKKWEEHMDKILNSKSKSKSKFPYECSFKLDGNKFIPTIIDYDNKQVWKQNSQVSDDGDWINFDELIFKELKNFKIQE
jgi:hypothetical protein